MEIHVSSLIGLQPNKTRAELDSSTVFETNILRVSPVKSSLVYFYVSFPSKKQNELGNSHRILPSRK